MNRIWVAVAAALFCASCSCAFSKTCARDSDCGDQGYCAENHFCITQCVQDRDCPSGCGCADGGRCLTPDAASCVGTIAPLDGGCTINSDCNTGAFCQDRACVIECRLQRDCPSQCTCEPLNGQCLTSSGARCFEVTDAGTDGGMDAGRDGGGPPIDADAGFDAGMDAGVDAGFDAGTDAGVDAGTDGGTDGGIP